MEIMLLLPALQELLLIILILLELFWLRIEIKNFFIIFFLYLNYFSSRLVFIIFNFNKFNNYFKIDSDFLHFQKVKNILFL